MASVSKPGIRPGWTPMAVLFIGLTSVLLLFGIAWLGERQRHNFLAVDVLDDLHIHLATFHIRIEEHLGADVAAVDLTPVWERWDRAARLVDTMLHGGLDDHGEPLTPLGREGYLATANRIASRMFSLRDSAERRLRSASVGVVDPGLERRFHDEFRAITRDIDDLEDLLEADGLRDNARSRRLIKVVCAAWVLIVLVSTAGLLRSERSRKRSEEQLRATHDVVLAQAGELRQHEQHLAEKVDERTAELSRAVEQLHAEIAERRLAEDALREKEAHIRSLSSRLLQAQEVERKRIAMELHDELGQALSAMKLQIRIVERRLGEGQEVAKGECEKVLLYIDHVIGDVRRLSLNLSPTILEDLGLTSALHWLVKGFAQNPGVTVTAEIAPIDRLFPEPVRIVIYRVVQEALTNVARHARASQVSVTIRQIGAEVAFLVEDDGVGFDVSRVLGNGPPETGFGLTTMQERVRMIGGQLDLSSRAGKGTRIAFSVPIETGGQ